METMTALKVFACERRRELVVACVAIMQGCDKTIPVRLCGIDPKIDMFRKRRRAVKHRGLTANEQILDSVPVKALEKVYDHAQLSGPGCANAIASSGATVRGASIAARPRLCRARWPRPRSGLGQWHPSIAGRFHRGPWPHNNHCCRLIKSKLGRQFRTTNHHPRCLKGMAPAH